MALSSEANLIEHGDRTHGVHVRDRFYIIPNGDTYTRFANNP